MKLNRSKGKFMSSGGLLILINVVPSNLLVLMMSFFEIHVGVLPFVPNSFGKAMGIRQNTIFLSGKFSVNPKTKMV